ncbi:MAG: hypothetical protein EPO20_30525 [Betaproteobacteria bacterium]|nr:MAG: hypothetical protein EPO20_30525 [Betaproteobacteria bacterium]
MKSKSIVQIFLTLATFVIIFIVWDEPDLRFKVVALLFILTWIFFYDKILGYDSDTGPWEFTWEGFETPAKVRQKLVAEYPFGDYELSLAPITINRPPVFVFIGKKDGTKFLFFCNALLDQRWVILTPPMTFNDLTYMTGTKKLVEIATEIWAGRKKAIENEIKNYAAEALEKAESADNQPIVVQGGG